MFFSLFNALMILICTLLYLDFYLKISFSFEYVIFLIKISCIKVIFEKQAKLYTAFDQKTFAANAEELILK